MERNTLRISCMNGHQAPNFCSQKLCPHPSSICTNQDCEYSKKHQDCYSTAKSTVLVKGLLHKQSMQEAQVDELVLEFIFRQIKILQTLKDEYLSSNRNYLIERKENEKLMLDFIQRGDMKQLKPVLVSETIESLSNKKEQKQRGHILRLKDIFDEVDTNIEKEISKVKYLINETQYSFCKDLQESQSVCILNQGKTARAVQTMTQMIFPLIFPSLSQTMNRKIKLKVKNNPKSQSSLMFFGLAKTKDIQTLKQGIGLFVSDDYCVVANHKDSDQDNVQIEFQVNEGDQIEMQYFSDSSQLKIGNLSTEKEYVLNNVTDEKRDLHYSIFIGEKDSQIEIMKQ